MTRQRRRTAALLAGATVLCAGSVGAQTIGSDSRTGYGSPQNFAIEVRAGTFQPLIDSEFGGRATPFNDIFSVQNPGTGSGCATNALCANNSRGVPLHPLFGFEFDWQIARLGAIGSIGVGVSAGFSTISAQAPTVESMNGLSNPMVSGCSAGTTSNPNCWTLSSETTTLDVVPLTAVAVFRLDGLARRYSWFPIVPYAKAGFAYSFWWIYKGGSIGTVTTGVDAMNNPVTASEVGGSFGYHVAVGAMVLLDVFSPREARQLDTEYGINHSYVFAEGYLTEMQPVSLLGNPQLNVGTLSWVAGIAFEF